MKVFYNDKFGGPEVITLHEIPIPNLKENSGNLIMKVEATALNRLDILQREGISIVPEGTTGVMGLEAAGYIVKLDGSIDREKPVIALLKGGGYGEFAEVHESQVMPLPKCLSISEGASIPEVFLTSYLGIRQLGELKQGQNVLIYAGASGVGTASIQLIRLFGAKSFVLVGTDEKVDFVKKLGADFVFNYKKESIDDISKEIFEKTSNKGVDLVFDCVGKSLLDLTLKTLALDSKWVLYGLLSGGKLDTFDLSFLLKKRIILHCTTLRTRSISFKKILVENFSKEVLPHFDNGSIKPIIDEIIQVGFDEEGLTKLKEAHSKMKNNENIGKIVLNFGVN